MNSTKYRKLVLTENWQDNAFAMVKTKVNIPRCFPCPFSVNFQRQHPKVLSEEAFWVSHNELCVGYHSAANPAVFWPVFSRTRQKLLYRVHYGKEEDGDGDCEVLDSIMGHKLKRAIRKYLTGLENIAIMGMREDDGQLLTIVRHFHIPMDCCQIILSFIRNDL